MAPESWCCGGFIIVVFLKMGASEIIYESPRLREAVTSTEDFGIYPSILGGFAEVIFLNELLRNV